MTSICIQRQRKDFVELVGYDFGCSSGTISVATNPMDGTFNDIEVHLRIGIGPYRGGHFVFNIRILEKYPFAPVEIWSRIPIWHPNIDVRTGKVHLPITWSPILNLVSIVIALQTIMIAPHTEYPLNNEASSLFDSSSSEFSSVVDATLHGGFIGGVQYDNAANCYCSHCEKKFCSFKYSSKRKYDEELENSFASEFLEDSEYVFCSFKKMKYEDEGGENS